MLISTAILPEYFYSLQNWDAPGQAELKGELKGDIKALDERLTTEIKGLTARVAYQEFTNRGILIALVVAILGGAAKLFGFFPNP